MTFNEIMDYHVDNPRIYKKIKSRIMSKSIVPFVGAGLSAFAYPLWIPCLRELTNTYITDCTLNSSINSLLDNGSCEEAAELLCDQMTDFTFFSALRDIFDDRKIDDARLEEQSVYLIPSLFSQLVLTTNFDLVLERAFLLYRRTLKVGYPNDTGAFFRALREDNGNILFKFHGDINKNTNEIVITKTTYDSKYRKGSSLVKSLKSLMKSRTLLFLGCGLKQDRTMELLTDILEDGIENYAIVDCVDGNQENRAKELSDKRIHALLYPPRNQHAALKIILEHLALDMEDLSSFVGYLTREECINRILDMQLGHQHAQKHLVFFGGVSSRLSGQRDIVKIEQWLKQNPERQVFFCYEKEDGALKRGQKIDSSSLPAEGTLPSDPVKRMDAKADMIETAISSYAMDVRDRVHLMPLKSDLNSYLIILDDQIYFNILTANKSLNSPVVRTTDDRIGSKIKKEYISYMLHELMTNSVAENSVAQDLLIEILSNMQ